MDRHAIYVHRHAKNDDFPIDFAIFTKALPTDGQTDRIMGGQTNEWTDMQHTCIDMQYTCIDMQERMIFQ